MYEYGIYIDKLHKVSLSCKCSEEVNVSQETHPPPGRSRETQTTPYNRVCKTLYKSVFV